MLNYHLPLSQSAKLDISCCHCKYLGIYSMTVFSTSKLLVLNQSSGGFAKSCNQTSNLNSLLHSSMIPGQFCKVA